MENILFKKLPIKFIPVEIEEDSHIQRISENLIQVLSLNWLRVNEEGILKSNRYVKFELIVNIYLLLKCTIASFLIICEVKNFNYYIGSSYEWPTKLLDIVGSPICQNRQQSLLMTSITVVVILLANTHMIKTSKFVQNCSFYKYLDCPQAYQIELNTDIVELIQFMMSENKRIYNRLKDIVSNSSSISLNRALLASNRNLKLLLKNSDILFNQSSVTTTFRRFEDIVIILYIAICSCMLTFLSLFILFYFIDTSSSTKVRCHYTTIEIIILGNLYLYPFLLTYTLTICSLKSYWVRLHIIKMKIDSCIQSTSHVTELIAENKATKLDEMNFIDLSEKNLLILFFEIAIFNLESKSLFKLINSLLTASATLLIGMASLVIVLSSFSLYPKYRTNEAIFHIILMNLSFLMYTKFNNSYESTMTNKIFIMMAQITSLMNCLELNGTASSYRYQNQPTTFSFDNNKQEPPSYIDLETRKKTNLNPFILIHWRKKMKNIDINKNVFSCQAFGFSLSNNLIIKVSYIYRHMCAIS